MQAFSALIDGLIYTRSRDHKVRLIADYLRSTPDPDRGWALAALAGTLSIATVKAAAIRAMAEVPGGIVGAGTLLTPADVKAAKAAGATFGVSPGATDRIIAACEDEGLPLLPGAATASEIMLLLEKGYTVQKFFPAEQSGGAAFLKSIGSPIPQVGFCPTGGISLKNARDYLSLSNILCVGGSWVAPKDAMARGDWATITALAAEARSLR